MTGHTPKKSDLNTSIDLSINEDGMINIRVNSTDPLLITNLVHLNMNTIMNYRHFNALTNQFRNLNNDRVTTNNRFNDIDLN